MGPWIQYIIVLNFMVIPGKIRDNIIFLTGPFLQWFMFTIDFLWRFWNVPLSHVSRSSLLAWFVTFAKRERTGGSSASVRELLDTLISMFSWEQIKNHFILVLYFFHAIWPGTWSDVGDDCIVLVLFKCAKLFFRKLLTWKLKRRRGCNSVEDYFEPRVNNCL